MDRLFPTFKNNTDILHAHCHDELRQHTIDDYCEGEKDISIASNSYMKVQYQKRPSHSDPGKSKDETRYHACPHSW